LDLVALRAGSSQRGWDRDALALLLSAPCFGRGRGRAARRLLRNLQHALPRVQRGGPRVAPERHLVVPHLRNAVPVPDGCPVS